MTMEELAALATLRFDWADTPDHVWRDSPYHVDGLHVDAMAAIDVGIRDAEGSDGPSPIGVVLQGQKGVGKTHLMGLVRRQVHAADGYFFLDQLTAGDAFWDNTAEALRSGLSQVDASGQTQVRSFLRRLFERAGVDADLIATILDGHRLFRKDIETFLSALAVVDPLVARDCADTARALVLYASEDQAAQNAGDDYLGGFDEPGDWRKWGIRRLKPARTRVREVTRLLASTGPIVIAVDQLDTLIARSAQVTQEIGDSGAEDTLVADIADGLMGLREVTRRTMTVLTCLTGTWEHIKARATDTVEDRFRESLVLGRIKNPDLARALVEQRLGVVYRAMDFSPPYPTWPVAPSAFGEDWEEITPRQLIKIIFRHIDACLRDGRVRELAAFTAEAPAVVGPRGTPVSERFANLDAWFGQLKSEADVSALLREDAEDDAIPELLSAALRSWITEVGDDDMAWACVPRDAVEWHAWLTHTLDEASDLEEYWAFQMISAPHHIAVLNRFRKARAAAGFRKGADNRRLVILRNRPWAKGPVTQQEIKEFQDAGGRLAKLSSEDVRTFWALNKMLASGDTALQEWLVERRPAGRSALLSEVLPAPSAERAAAGSRPPPADSEITLGTDVETGEPVRIELAALRKHAAVFAGSGSGKTVLLRRIVEECALRGVSAIVLDPNNDLARLGDAWPQAPDGWGPHDAELAQRYLADTDVVVWTPGRAAGRPLAFQPLPDFAGVLSDDDEFGAAVEVAVATLAPQVRLTGSTVKANIGLAVLRQAVVHYARGGSRSLLGLIDVLADLPDGVSTLNDSRHIAADLAEALKAAMVNDHLLAGGGEPVDPGELLTPAAGMRSRVSVVSFVGLPSEEQRQNFVNQLQMELFAWVKRNPAGDQPLGALFVMDEAQTLAASGSLTASTRSTIVLASQARKYGLGLLFATQAPKGLHNQVVGNAMTQFFGRLNSPAQITAANELARAKGSTIADISRLERGEFYVSGEAFGFHKVTTPLCLTHHPASPLRIEEVLDRAHRTR
jgi:hypothetical protein